MQPVNYKICASVLASSALYQTSFGLSAAKHARQHLEGAGWRIIKDGLILILVRGPKNSVLLHSGD